MPGDHKSDEILLRRAHAGDGQAAKELWARYQRRLHGLVDRKLPRRLRRRVSVADIVQETQIAALTPGNGFRAGARDGYQRWLFGIAENKVREALRRHEGSAKRAAGNEVSRSQRPETGQFRGRDPSPSQVAAGAELAGRIERALESLPEDYRLVLRLTREQGMTTREAAEHLGRSAEATKKLYGRAFLRFKQAFEELA